jgi:Uma2 family endonuclease
MQPSTQFPERSHRTDTALDAGDAIVHVHNVSWTTFEGMLRAKGDAPVPRYAYLDGELEIMSPGRVHERVKKNLARLIETYGTERDVPLHGMGSWTLKDKLKKAGVEPDECYFVGREDGDMPDLAIEVLDSSAAGRKLPIYARLGVREVWIWRHGTIEIHTLRDGAITAIPKSELLPEPDLAMLTMLAPQTDQHTAVKTWVRWLRAGV